MSTYRERDVILVRFSFERRDQIKIRPAVILSVEPGRLLLAPCSQGSVHEPRAVRIGIEDFEEGGLDLFEESFVLISHQTYVSIRSVIGKRGRLTEEAYLSLMRDSPSTKLLHQPVH